MKYSKLSRAAKEKARDWYRTDINDFEWWDSTYEHWKEQLKEKGFTDADIRFSGFSSEGDGASFTSGIDREFKLPDGIAKALEEATAVQKVLRRFEGKSAVVDMSWELSGKITRSTSARHVHPYTISAEMDLQVGDDVPEDVAKMFDDWAELMRQALTQESRDLSNEIYRALEAEWDYVNSNECVEENITCNDYEFDRDGEFNPRAWSSPASHLKPNL